MDATTAEFEEAVRQALNQPIHGRDDSYFNGRIIDPGVPWDYRRRVVQLGLTPAKALLVLGTRDGEWLAQLRPLPTETVATEADPAQVQLARQQLDPFGISVYQVEPDGPLPFPDARFDLIIDYCTAFNAREVFRILRPGGHFFTEQRGGFHYIDLNRVLQAPWDRNASWNLQAALDAMRQTGFIVEDAQEAFPLVGFADIQAVIYYLRLVPGQIPDFQVDRYRSRLWLVYQTIQHAKALYVEGHRFFLEATKTASIDCGSHLK